MSSLQEHMERAARMSDDERAVIRDPMVNAAVEATRDRLRRADAERYERYDALEVFLTTPGFDRPEGIVIFHHASRDMFKVTLEGDEAPKGAAAHAHDEERIAA